MSSKSKSSSSLEEKKAPASSNKDLWQQAIEYKQQQLSTSSPSPSTDTSASTLSSSPLPPPSSPSLRESTVLFLGPRVSGKSTLMSHFMFKDRDETPKPTSSLHYQYTKTSLKDSMNDEKSLSHLYEIGGGRSFISLVDLLLHEKNIQDTMVVLTIDLSAPSRILNDLQYYITVLHHRCDVIMKENHRRSTLTPPLCSPLPDLVSKQKKQYGENHPDISQCTPLPLQVLVVATKFDLTSSLPPESLKQLSRAIRYFCHIHGCHLTFTQRNQRDQYEKFYRQKLTQHIMNTAETKKIIQADINQPIYITMGSDSIQNIGDPPSAGTAKTTWGQWIFSMSKFFPQSEEKEKEMGSIQYHYNSDTIDISSSHLLGVNNDQSGNGHSEYDNVTDPSLLSTFSDLNLSEEKLIDGMLRSKEEDLKKMIRENITKRKVAAVEVKVK